MYGLVQVARQFYTKLTCVTVMKMGFVKCETDGCLLLRVTNDGTVILCIYDDMIVVGDKEEIEKSKQ